MVKSEHYLNPFPYFPSPDSAKIREYFFRKLSWIMTKNSLTFTSSSRDSPHTFFWGVLWKRIREVPWHCCISSSCVQTEVYVQMLPMLDDNLTWQSSVSTLFETWALCYTNCIPRPTGQPASRDSAVSASCLTRGVLGWQVYITTDCFM